MSDFRNVIVAFGSLVVIPFLGLLSVFKVRVFRYLVAFSCFWLYAGLIAIAGGAMPIGPGDIVTPAQRQAWFDSAFVALVTRLWLTGIAISVPILFITWAHEHRHLSRYVRLLSDLISLVGFVGGLWAFFQIIVLPG